MAELRPLLPAIRQAGGDLVIVGTGDPASARAFQQDLNITDVPVFTDPQRRAFDLAGFRRGILPLLRPRAVWNYIRAYFAGHQAGRLQGDPLQQGGVLVINRDGSLLFRHVSRASGDHPKSENIVAAVRSTSPVSRSSVS